MGGQLKSRAGLRRYLSCQPIIFARFYLKRRKNRETGNFLAGLAYIIGFPHLADFSFSQ
jgi:hypothetical protein